MGHRHWRRGPINHSRLDELANGQNWTVIGWTVGRSVGQMSYSSDNVKFRGIRIN